MLWYMIVPTYNGNTLFIIFLWPSYGTTGSKDRIHIAHSPDDPAILLDDIVEEQNRVCHFCPLLDPDPRKQNGIPDSSFNNATVVGHTVFHHCLAAYFERLAIPDITMFQVGPQPPFLHIDLRILAQQVHTGFPVFVDGSCIAPIAFIPVPVYLAVALHHHGDECVPWRTNRESPVRYQ